VDTTISVFLNLVCTLPVKKDADVRRDQ
jgi:hypothetical protein